MISFPEFQDERRSRLLDAMPAIAWSASVQTFTFNYVNRAAETILGYPAADWLVPNFWFEHLHPDDRFVATFCHNETLAVRDHELEYRMVAADGRSVWLRDYVKVHSVDGVPVEIFGVMVDITREREAAQLRAAAEAKFRWLVEHSMVAVYMISGERLTYINDTGARMLGYTVDELTSLDVASLFHEDRPGVARVRRKDGTLQHVALYENEIVIDGEPIIIGTCADITESTRAQQALEEAKRMSSLGQVAASLAHEFNNVLMGIQPFVEIISRPPTTRAVTDAVGHITRAISRGKRASQEILRFANPKEPQLFTIDTSTWLPNFLGQLIATLPCSISLSHSMDPSVRFIRGDREHLEQVITNLVFNARDAIANCGTIHVGVSLSDDGESVRISVCDDGCGVPPEMLERIFEPLFTTKRNGTGLGLAIARRMMERQGGALTAENLPEGGAAFHVLVRAENAPCSLLQRLERTTPGVKRILLVEDDFAVGTGLEMLLQSEGYETTWVRLAADACDAANRTSPEVAIIDVNLPDGSGVDLVPLLRAEHANLPIVLSTGHVELSLSDEKQRILSLMKPYVLTDLLSAIGNVTKAA